MGKKPSATPQEIRESNTALEKFIADSLPKLEISESALDWALSIHEDQAPSDRAFNLIAGHCVVVALLTQDLCRTAPDAALLDSRLAVLGALIHDIGTYQILDNDGSKDDEITPDQITSLTFHSNYIQHGFLGYELLLDAGADESVAQFARNHTGVGLTAQAVREQKLDLPEGDYSPQTSEQKIVMYADKFHSKSDPPAFLTASVYAQKAAKYGEANRGKFLELVSYYGEPNVYALAESYGLRVRQ